MPDNGYQTIEEIERDYEGEWVIIDQPRVLPGPEILGGYVVYHTDDPEQVNRKSLELRLSSSAVLFMGDPVEGQAFIL